jgi:hypothetical protein
VASANRRHESVGTSPRGNLVQEFREAVENGRTLPVARTARHGLPADSLRLLVGHRHCIGLPCCTRFHKFPWQVHVRRLANEVSQQHQQFIYAIWLCRWPTPLQVRTVPLDHLARGQVGHEFLRVSRNQEEGLPRGARGPWVQDETISPPRSRRRATAFARWPFC